jgi:hypothetical protein
MAGSLELQGICLSGEAWRETVRRRALRSVLAALAATLVLSSCTGGGGHHPAAHAGGGRHLSFRLAARTYGLVKTAVPAQPIATGATIVGGIEAEVYVLKRVSANTVLLVMAFHNTTSGNVGFTTAADWIESDASGVERSFSGATLFDPAGLKQYLVYRANSTDLNSLGACLCSDANALFDWPTGQRVWVAALYPAPPASVHQLIVQAPFGAVASVPVS